MGAVGQFLLLSCRQDALTDQTDPRCFVDFKGLGEEVRGQLAAGAGSTNMPSTMPTVNRFGERAEQRLATHAPRSQMRGSPFDGSRNSRKDAMS